MDPFDLRTYREESYRVSEAHASAIVELRMTGEEHARAEAKYHRVLAVAIAALIPEVGKTLAETQAKGTPEVQEAKISRDISAAYDRAAMERLRKLRDDRASLLTMGAWSRANEEQS